MNKYEAIDRQSQYNWRQERLKIARKLGYNYISESIIETYLLTDSAAKTGQLCGGITANGIRLMLKKWGVPINPPGGFRPGDHRWGRAIY